MDTDLKDQPRMDANKMWEDKSSILAISTAPGTARAIATPAPDVNFVCIYSRKFASIRGSSFKVCVNLRLAFQLRL